MNAATFRDPACRLHTIDDMHVCRDNTGAALSTPAKCCYEWARLELHAPVTTFADSAVIVDEHLLVALVEVALRNDCRTVTEQTALARVCAHLDRDATARALNQWTARADATWKAKPCRCATDSVMPRLPLDVALCDVCTRDEARERGACAADLAEVV